MSKVRFLYVGGFQLPDKNAAAQRVISIAKALRTLGYEVLFINYGNNKQKKHWKEYFEFQCCEFPKRSMLKQLTDVSDVIDIIKEKNISNVIAYNYPAVSFSRLLRFCKRESILCYADATEWYVPQGGIIYNFFKRIDTEWRMKKIQPECDGVIAISEYLYQYYKNLTHTVKIPPTVDLADAKWETNPKQKQNKKVFVYAGMPGKIKERLDTIIEAVENIDENIEFQVIGITQKQYEATYNKIYFGRNTRFFGRVPHENAIRMVKEADWTIVVRENNKVVQAGFPTKIAESISCGTPVIANYFSNISDYLNESNSILCNTEEIETAIRQACKYRIKVDNSIFDYHRFIPELSDLFSHGHKQEVRSE